MEWRESGDVRGVPFAVDAAGDWRDVEGQSDGSIGQGQAETCNSATSTAGRDNDTARHRLQITSSLFRPMSPFRSAQTVRK
jgi:hypothetical protein